MTRQRGGLIGYIGATASAEGAAAVQRAKVAAEAAEAAAATERRRVEQERAVAAAGRRRRQAEAAQAAQTAVPAVSGAQNGAQRADVETVTIPKTEHALLMRTAEAVLKNTTDMRRTR